MPACLSKIDNITKYIVNGWMRMQQYNFNIQIPLALNAICINYYHLDEIFVCKSKIKYWNRKFSKNKKCISITACINQHNTTHNNVTELYDSPQIIYGINEILLKNQYNKFIYYWELKFNRIQDAYSLWPVFVMIGFVEINNISPDSTKKYCNDGQICDVHTWNMGKKTKRKHYRKFGENDIVSVCLNTNTMKVKFNINDNAKTTKYRLFEEPQERRVRLQLIVCAPDVEIELIRFDRHKC